MGKEVAAAEANKGSAVAAAAVAVADASKNAEEQLAKDTAAGKEGRRAKEVAATAEAKVAIVDGQPTQEASVKLDPLKVSSTTRPRVSQADKGYPRRASQPASAMSKDVSAVAVSASVRPEAAAMPPKDRRLLFLSRQQVWSLDTGLTSPAHQHQDAQPRDWLER